MRRSVIASITAAAVLVVAGFAVLQVRREREWSHGGDRLAVDVEVAVATADTFESVVVRLGAPSGEATRLHTAEQSVVIQVRWADSSPSDGSFEVIALDKRVHPPRPLAAEGGWNAQGGTGTNWASAYESLARRYEWLAGTAAANYADGSGMTDFPNAAVSAPAAEAGTVTAWFRQWGEGPIPLADPTRDVMVALVHVDVTGEVRWARRIFG